ncbi:MAG: hypothetical protein J7K54_00790 [Candidatus Aenigmarchaeota archaeon]|nr:hypothetical protein [Candidatus Aenigmarchaeota archaeon]
MDNKLLQLILGTVFFAMLSTSAVAQLGVPHQFFGMVNANGATAPDGLTVSAKIDGSEVASTTTIAGAYGLKPGDIFYIEDPDGNRNGDVIEFYVNGIKAAEYVFNTGGSTQLDLSVSGDLGICGDGHCNDEENSSNCEADCGPHQFFGDVLVNNISAPDGIIIKAKLLDEEIANTTTNNGSYGIGNGNEFLIHDYGGEMSGKTIEFFVADKEAGEYMFSNWGFTELQFSVSGDFGVCGDNYCRDDDEDCETCSTDCGPCIPIISGSHGFYGTVVYNEGTPVSDGVEVSSYINDTLSGNTTVQNGTYGYPDGFYVEGATDGDVIKFYVGDALVTDYIFQGGTITKLDLIRPDTCGDGLCTGSETCSSCQADCGKCTTTGGGSTGRSGSSSGSGGGIVQPAPCVENWSCSEWSICSQKGTQLRTCNDLNACGTEENKPVEKQSCTYDLKAEMQVCSPGTTMCVGDDLRECRDNSWKTIKTCEYGCDSDALLCKTASGGVETQGFFDYIGTFFRGLFGGGNEPAEVSVTGQSVGSSGLLIFGAAIAVVLAGFVFFFIRK